MNSNPTPEEMAAAIADIEEARESHVLWRDRLNSGTESEESIDSGDAYYHQVWVSKYDSVLKILRAIQSTQRQSQQRIEELEKALELSARRYHDLHTSSWTFEECQGKECVETRQALNPKKEGTGNAE